MEVDNEPDPDADPAHRGITAFVVTRDMPGVSSGPIHGKLGVRAGNTGWVNCDEVRVPASHRIGEEGEVRGLFSLSVSFNKTQAGLEMELMVGLTDTHPIHRTKYVPSVLSKTLRDWLDASIGEGIVEQGAFVWRGALRRGSGALRSVQLADRDDNGTRTRHAQRRHQSCDTPSSRSMRWVDAPDSIRKPDSTGITTRRCRRPPQVTRRS